MKKVLSMVCALFLTVVFAGVTLAAEKDKEMKPTPTDNMMKAPEQMMEQQPMMEQKPMMEKQPMMEQNQMMEQKPMEKKY